MKIENKRKNFCTPIVDIEFGEIFRHNGSIFIKTDEEDDNGWCCVDLVTGEISVFYNDEEVEILNGILIIE